MMNLDDYETVCDDCSQPSLYLAGFEILVVCLFWFEGTSSIMLLRRWAIACGI